MARYLCATTIILKKEYVNAQLTKGLTYQNICRSPFTRATASINKSYELSPETDISFVSSGRPSVDKLFPSFYDGLESGPRSSISSDMDTISSTSSYSGHKFIDMNSLQHEFSSSSIESENSGSSRNMVRQFF